MTLPPPTLLPGLLSLFQVQFGFRNLEEEEMKAREFREVQGMQVHGNSGIKGEVESSSLIVRRWAMGSAPYYVK